MSDSAQPQSSTDQPVDVHPPAHDAVAELTAELDAARKRIDELARAYQASERDKEDFKKRVQRERERMLDVERGSIAVALVEAIDQLDLSLSVADASPLATGVRLIRDGLLKRCAELGVSRVELLNQLFDPNQAEATDMEVTADSERDNRVTAVMRACYQLKDRVIRPGQVRVARFVSPAQA